MRINDATYEAMLATARETDQQRSQDEAEHNIRSPSESFESLLRTTKDALECAIKCQDWQIACEAMIFLQQALVRLREPTWRFGKTQ